MSGIRFTHIDHCSVIVTNVDRSRDFYGRVLGLKEIPVPREFDFVAIWYWVGLYVALVLCILAFRLGNPLWLSFRHDLLVYFAAASLFHAAIRALSTRLGCPAPMPTVAPSFA